MAAALLGCGLRRAELAAAQVQDQQQPEEHWVFADLTGKGGHIRTVPIPDWVADAVRAWLAQAGVTEGAAFRAINKAGRMAANGFTPKVIWVWSSKLLPRADYRMWRRTTFAAHAPVCVTKPGAHQCPDNRTVFGLQTTLEEFRQRQHRSRAPCTASTSDMPTIRQSEFCDCRAFMGTNLSLGGTRLCTSNLRMCARPQTANKERHLLAALYCARALSFEHDRGIETGAMAFHPC